MASLETVDKLRDRTGVSYDDAREALDSSDGDVLDALIWLEKNGKIEPPRVSHYSTEVDEDSGDDAFSGAQYGASNRYYDVNERKAGHYKEKERREKKSGSKEKRSEYSKHGGGRAYSASGKKAKRKYAANHSYYYDENDRRTKNSSGATFFKSLWTFLGKAFQVGNSTMFEITRNGQDFTKIPLTFLVVLLIMFFHVVIILLPVGLFFGFRYKLTGNSFDDGPLNAIFDMAAKMADGIKDMVNGKKNA